MRKLKNKIICIVGESGSGKTALYDLLRKEGYGVVDSYTTRFPRYPDEQGHTFITQEEFNALRGDFAAYTKFDKYEYATTFEQLDGNEFYIIDPAGIEVLSKKVGRDQLIVVYLHVLAPTRFERMRKDRGEKEAIKRIQHDYSKFMEFKDEEGWDYKLNNEEPQDLYTNMNFLERLAWKVSNSEV